MKIFNVFIGEYPFSKKLGQIKAITAELALDIALTIYGNHCVVASVEPPATKGE